MKTLSIPLRCILIRKEHVGTSLMAALLACLALFILGVQNGYAQDQLPVPPDKTVSHDLPVDSSLYKAYKHLPSVQRRMPDQQTVQRFAGRGVNLRADGKIFVEIICPRGDDVLEALDLSALEALEVEIGVDAAGVADQADSTGKDIQVPLSVFENRAEAWLPLSQVPKIASLLPEGCFIREVKPLNHDEVAGQGPAVTNSVSYGNAGSDGSGLTIAVIDSGFFGLTAAQTNGDAPAAYTALNYTPDPFEAAATGTHGTGCVEAAFDHAPGATWRIYKINSLTDLGTAADDAIANGVNIISHSLSWYNEGWADNTGDACAAANNASDNGILFFTAAGNRAQQHYQGDFADTDDDGWHEFAPGDESINISIGPGKGPGGPYFLCWSNSDTDLDFYLFDAALNVVASSTNGVGHFEEFSFQHDDPEVTFYLGVHCHSGSKDTAIEIFSHNAGTWQQHAVAANSTTSPSNSTYSLVISVGAVYYGSFGQPNGSNVIAGYSSRGPSNSGITQPDLCGPTSTAGFTYPAPAGFSGTSCATPNAAAAACAFWSSDTQLSAYAIQWLIKAQAGLWRDWGAPGSDNTYGRGGVRLVDYHFGTRWVARSYPGTADLPTAPYYTVQGAHDALPDTGRLLIFGNTYPESALLGATGKQMTVQVVSDSGSAILGQ